MWARAQSAGRGRQGKKWASKPGNLYCTALLNVGLEARLWTQLSFVAGLAVYDAAAGCLEGATRSWQLALKWPNDLLLNGQKVSGTLLESTIVQDVGSALAIGIGLNVRHSPADATPPYGATHICELGGELDAEAAFGRLAKAFDEWHQVWAGGAGFARIREVWTQRAHGIGEEVAVNMPDETLTGCFAGLDDDGAMVLRLYDGTERRILVGDLFLASQAGAALDAATNGTT